MSRTAHHVRETGPRVHTRRPDPHRTATRAAVVAYAVREG